MYTYNLPKNIFPTPGKELKPPLRIYLRVKVFIMSIIISPVYGLISVLKKNPI